MKKAKSTPRKAKPSIALSVRQPWAWLIVNGYKDIENRSWDFEKKLKGQRVYIHAGKTEVETNTFKQIKNLKFKGFPKSRHDFEFGAIVGSVELGKITNDSDFLWAQV